jgi:hypothetical protein
MEIEYAVWETRRAEQQRRYRRRLEAGCVIVPVEVNGTRPDAFARD